MDGFKRHLKRASEIVAGWPKWKRDLASRLLRPQHERDRAMRDDNVDHGDPRYAEGYEAGKQAGYQNGYVDGFKEGESMEQMEVKNAIGAYVLRLVKHIEE